MQLWKGRFSKEIDPKTNDFNSSIKFDSRMYKEDIDGSIAHATMLSEQGIISSEDKEAIVTELKKIKEDTGGIPIYITENGSPENDLLVDGQVHDKDRTYYIETYLNALLKATNQGLPVEGYFLWSSFDNFEWNEGTSIRMGIVYVDYETQERIIKDSGKFYANYIKEHRN